ncbi:MAG: hypothetical protein HFJ38_06085 [Bacilli bacterium]|nr:hypothetical protein [Bacilli bacterium]
MKGDFILMYMCGYPTYCCPYPYGNNNNYNDGFGGSWVWIIIVLFILFFVFWGGSNNNCRGNGFN